MKSLKSEWSNWSEKVLQFGKLEAKSRPAISNLIEMIDVPYDSIYSERGKSHSHKIWFSPKF